MQVKYVILWYDGGTSMAPKVRCWSTASWRHYTLYNHLKSATRICLKTDYPSSVTRSTLYATVPRQNWSINLQMNTLLGTEKSTAHMLLTKRNSYNRVRFTLPTKEGDACAKVVYSQSRLIKRPRSLAISQPFHICVNQWKIKGLFRVCTLCLGYGFPFHEKNSQSKKRPKYVLAVWTHGCDSSIAQFNIVHQIITQFNIWTCWYDRKKGIFTGYAYPDSVTSCSRQQCS